MHYFVEKERGKAKDQLCVDCGCQARDWSRIHGTCDDRDPNTFEPRCRKCHMEYDDHKRDQRGKPLPAHVLEAARLANTGNTYNVGRERPDVAERNRAAAGWHQTPETRARIAEGMRRFRRKSAAE